MRQHSASGSAVLVAQCIRQHSISNIAHHCDRQANARAGTLIQASVSLKGTYRALVGQLLDNTGHGDEQPIKARREVQVFGWTARNGLVGAITCLDGSGYTKDLERHFRKFDLRRTSTHLNTVVRLQCHGKTTVPKQCGETTYSAVDVASNEQLVPQWCL